MKKHQGEKRVRIGDWITPPIFSEFQNRRIAFLFGKSLFNITNIQFNIHKINSVTSPHSHPDFQIIYYSRGFGVQTVGKEDFEVTPKRVFFIPPHTIHFFNPSSRSVVEAFTMRFEIILNLGKNLKKVKKDKEMQELAKFLFMKEPRCIVLTVQEAKEVELYLQKINEILAVKEFGYLIALKGYILLLLRLFLLSAVRKEKDVQPPTRAQLSLLKAVSLINQNLDQPIRLKDIARNCYISSNYLQKIFKRYLGKSFTRYVNESKINYAKELLKTTTLSIDQIAEKCGIYDSNYFTRLFKKIEGCPPSHFRKSV